MTNFMNVNFQIAGREGDKKEEEKVENEHEKHLSISSDNDRAGVGAK